MTIKGYIEHIIYRNSENGYTVCNFVCEEEEIICVGSFRSIDVGETLSLTGDFVDHAIFSFKSAILCHSSSALIPNEKLLGRKGG